MIEAGGCAGFKYMMGTGLRNEEKAGLTLVGCLTGAPPLTGGEHPSAFVRLYLSKINQQLTRGKAVGMAIAMRMPQH